jgi:hypothetical protein
MKIFKSILILSIFISFYGYSQVDLENTIKKEFKLNYDLNIMEDPISVRNLFIKNQDIVSDYISFVTNANRSWYFNYFNLNSMRRYGWNSYQELYENRFLTWNKWREDLILPYGDYEWFKPKFKFIFGSDYFTDLTQYSIRLANENFYIRRQLDLLGNNAIEPAELASVMDNKNSKVVRDDILTVLSKKGKKFKVVDHPGKNNSWITRNNRKYSRLSTNNSGFKDARLYNNSPNSNNGFSNNQNGSSNSVPTVTRSVVSTSGTTSANASNSSGSTSVVSAPRKQ